MACMFTFDSATGPYTFDSANGPHSLEVSRTGNMIRFSVCDASDVCLDRDMDLREMLRLLQVTPQMLRGLADELEPENEEEDS